MNLEPDAQPAPSTSNATLTEEERMLVLLRDELYEGDWNDFAQDLRDRLEGKPHVFEIQPASPRLQDTIRRHLQLITALHQRERRERVNLAAFIQS